MKLSMESRLVGQVVGFSIIYYKSMGLHVKMYWQPMLSSAKQMEQKQVSQQHKVVVNPASYPKSEKRIQS